jgi:hypothetical protein
LLDLAQSGGIHICRGPGIITAELDGGASLLVSGDIDLLVMAGQTEFLIETPEAYRLRVEAER